MRLKEWLRENGKTQRDFAGEVGISQAMLSRMMRGERSASLRIAKQIKELTSGAVGMEDWDIPGESDSA